MSAKPVRTLITVIMDLLVVLAVLVTASVVVQFFGALSSQTWGEAVLKLAGLVSIPFGVEAIKTPYGGAFDVDGVLTILVLLLVEWVLGGVRARA